MLEMYMKELFLLVFFFVVVSCIVETVKELFQYVKFLPTFSKNFLRLFSFFTAYVVAWAFNFTLVQTVFQMSTKSKDSLPEHINYIILACLIFIGAKGIYKKGKETFKDLTGKD